MIKTKKEKIIQNKVLFIACDICKKEYIDDFEMQEFLFIGFYGGYSSIFGDESFVQCDICQYCLKEKLGKWLNIS